MGSSDPDVGPSRASTTGLGTLNSPQSLSADAPIRHDRREGQKWTLRRIATYADAPNSWPEQASAYKWRRPSSSAQRALRKRWHRLRPHPQDHRVLAEQMAQYAQVGVQEVHVMPPGPDPGGFVWGLGRGWSRRSRSPATRRNRECPHGPAIRTTRHAARSEVQGTPTDAFSLVPYPVPAEQDQKPSEGTGEPTRHT
jgi:hypothetical protein